ncbi:hypothetical protein RUM44_007357 [Polyplax serrata]|uniref:Uncharacterized protein n=1 Tax=Polyplax serrata TaxID=468196 RepID=A0ABR1B0I5_POLSC
MNDKVKKERRSERGKKKEGKKIEGGENRRKKLSGNHASSRENVESKRGKFDALAVVDVRLLLPPRRSLERDCRTLQKTVFPFARHMLCWRFHGDSDLPLNNHPQVESDKVVRKANEVFFIRFGEMADGRQNGRKTRMKEIKKG